MPKKIAILGSTGSIGKNTLQVVRHLHPEIQIISLASKSNIDLLEAQAKEFCPQLVAVYDKKKALELSRRIPEIRVVGGEEGIIEAATMDEVDFVLGGISGASGIKPILAAIEKGKQIGLANKEILVAAGPFVMKRVKEKNSVLIPIDSEHSALFQCLKGEKKEEVHRLILTASGGPFREYSKQDLLGISVEKALSHPNYLMGAKNTIDSSTLMNKGLEMIEAHFLFDIPVDQIEVVIHPEQIIHSFVDFVDGSTLAQLSYPKMVGPIQYALTYPVRKPSLLQYLDFSKMNRLDFYQPDTQRFRCLDLAYISLREGGSMPCFMNAVNEVLVNRFLNREISWMDIAEKLEFLMNRHSVERELNLEKILNIDTDAREEANVI